jgi:hypothetical protein
MPESPFFNPTMTFNCQSVLRSVGRFAVDLGKISRLAGAKLTGAKLNAAFNSISSKCKAVLGQRMCPAGGNPTPLFDTLRF